MNVGIWGFGIVGKSALRYFAQQGHTVYVHDKQLLAEADQVIVDEHGGIYDPTMTLEQFFAVTDLIMPSPGVDIRPYPFIFSKCKAEVDIFYDAWRSEGCATPIIAITGTIGKTSVTHLLTQLLEAAGKRVKTGGNSSHLALLDLLPYRFLIDYVVIELSSFQLEYAHHFAPDVALWTNLLAKHLDRHATMDDYWRAKYNIMKHQTYNQVALVPVWMKELITNHEFQGSAADRYYWSEYELKEGIRGYGVTCTEVVKSIPAPHVLCKLSDFPEISFQANWILLAAALDTLGLVPQPLFCSRTFDIPEHRGQLVAEVNGVRFYNDSKSTLFEATLKAIERLQHMPLIVLIGGITEENDRYKQIPLFKDKVVQLVCFGVEAQQLAKAAVDAHIPAVAYATLEEAVQYARAVAQPGYGILLSPGGPSYDLFANHQERGQRFCSLVLDGASHAQVG